MKRMSGLSMKKIIRLAPVNENWSLNVQGNFKISRLVSQMGIILTNERVSGVQEGLTALFSLKKIVLHWKYQILYDYVNDKIYRSAFKRKYPDMNLEQMARNFVATYRYAKPSSIF